MLRSLFGFRWSTAGLAAAGWLCVFALAAPAEDAPGGGRRSSSGGGRSSTGGSAAETEEGKMDYKANDQLTRGLERIKQGQEELGLKLITDIPKMFPKSKIRFKAYATLGQHYVTKRNFDLAIKQFLAMQDSEDEEERAEALYRIGICQYSLNNYDKAFASLRKVTNVYPWSVYANEAYYYIGQCHFKLGRWSKAVEALELVGTSVPMNAKGEVLAEAGQRLFVKIQDKDLVVLKADNETLNVIVKTGGGDSEKLTLEPFGKSGEYFLGSIQTVPDKATPNDGNLQIMGSDTATVEYQDVNTESGQRNQKVLQNIRFVSTASIGFTDGAYKEYVKGVFGDNKCFVRIRDLDADTSHNPDTMRVRVYTQYKVEKEEDLTRRGVDLAEQPAEYAQRDVVEVTLTETGPHAGIFVGFLQPAITADVAAVVQGDDQLSVMQGDKIILEYTDELYVGSSEPRDLEYAAQYLVGKPKNVEMTVREVDDPEVKAKAALIEAKIFLRLGEIFKEVGLTTKASDKADQGLDRVGEVVRMSQQKSLDRSIVEEAFSIKWDLLLVQGKLAEAIQVCQTLMKLFPDTSLADKALHRIGQAKLEQGDIPGAIQVFNAVTKLPKSPLKAEAQYNIAVALEKEAEERCKKAKGQAKEPDLSKAMTEYKKCADLYPDSPFAGDSLDKIAEYYLRAKDYQRASELMERVFQDYPDASFLDKMLLKWVVAEYRRKRMDSAKQKVDQFLADYPNSPLAEKARSFQKIIDRKAGGGGDE